MSTELTIKGDVERLHLEPGDRLVVTLDVDTIGRFQEWIDRVRPQLEDEFPGHKIIFLTRAATLSVAGEARDPLLDESANAGPY